MIEKRPFDELGGADLGWLRTRHHFSFADYSDGRRMGWGGLRVWNDDEIEPNTGFPLHPHANMEIITYVIEGAISHKDSLGNSGRTAAGDVQVMSAGTGIRHAEYNAEARPTRIFQIWILPSTIGGEPTWDTKPFPRHDRSGSFTVLASGIPGDRDGLPIRANARVLGATLKAGEKATYHIGAARYGYLVPATGSVEVNGAQIKTRDGVALSGVESIEVTALADSELVLVDAA